MSTQKHPLLKLKNPSQLRAGQYKFILNEKIFSVLKHIHDSDYTCTSHHHQNAQ